MFVAKKRLNCEAQHNEVHLERHCYKKNNPIESRCYSCQTLLCHIELIVTQLVFPVHPYDTVPVKQNNNKEKQERKKKEAN